MFKFKIVIFFLCSLFGIINSTKLIESDLLLYEYDFNRSEGLNLFEYLILVKKDFLYYLLNFVFSNHISNSFKLFLFFVTFISYVIYFLTLLNFSFDSSKVMVEKYTLILIGMFMPLLFSLSGHLIRQFLAISIALMALSVYEKRNFSSLMLLIISILIHSSCALFILYFVFRIKNSIFKWVIFFLGLLFFLLFRDLFDNIPGFTRLNSIEIGANLQPLGLNVITFVIVNFSFVLILFFRRKVHPSFSPLFKVFSLLCMLVLYFRVENNHEVATRLLPFIYFIWPLVLFFFLKQFKEKRILFYLSIFFNICIFSYSLFSGTWTYFV